MSLKNYKFEYDFKRTVSTGLKSKVFLWFLDNEENFDYIRWNPQLSKVFFYYRGFMFGYQIKLLQQSIDDFCNSLDELSIDD